MNFSKYRIAVPAAIIACLLVTATIWAQSGLVIRANPGTGDVFLGISMEDVTASNMSEYRLADEKGVIVRSVQEESPAGEAGLRENDVILEFAGQSVWSARQLSRLVTETPAGRSVAMTVSRNGNRINLSATLRIRTERGTAQRFEALPGQMERFFEALPPGGQMDRFFEAFPDGQPRPPRTPGQARPDAQGRGGGRGASPDNPERSEPRPRLGVETQPLTEQMAEYMGVPGKKGVLIASVLNGSASEGKLKAGDVIISVNDQDVANPADLTRYVGEASGEVTVKVIRDKKQISVNINLSSDEPQSGGGYRL